MRWRAVPGRGGGDSGSQVPSHVGPAHLALALSEAPVPQGEETRDQDPGPLYRPLTPSPHRRIHTTTDLALFPPASCTSYSQPPAAGC